MPQLHDETFARALRRAAGYEPEGGTIEDRLSKIPTVESLADLPEGTPVWIRADLDVADRDGIIGDDPGWRACTRPSKSGGGTAGECC